MRSARNTALIVALGVLTPCAALAQQPDASEAPSKAESLAARGFEAYGKGDFPTALTLYQEAARLSPAAALFFNIANIYDKKLPDPQLALEFYRKCIAASDATGDLTLKATARIQAINQELAQKQAQKPETAPPPTDNKEDKPVGSSVSEPADPGKGLRTAGLVLMPIGVAAFIPGIILGIDAKVKVDRAREVCNGAECTSQAGIDDMGSAGDSATGSTICFVAGGATAAVGLGLYIFGLSDTEPLLTPSTGVRITPVVGPSVSGIWLSGAFF